MKLRLVDLKGGVRKAKRELKKEEKNAKSDESPLTLGRAGCLATHGRDHPVDFQSCAYWFHERRPRAIDDLQAIQRRSAIWA
jgi:hypothetical protein